MPIPRKHELKNSR